MIERKSPVQLGPRQLQASQEGKYASNPPPPGAGSSLERHIFPFSCREFNPFPVQNALQLVDPSEAYQPGPGHAGPVLVQE